MCIDVLPVQTEMSGLGLTNVPKSGCSIAATQGSDVCIMTRKVLAFCSQRRHGPTKREQAALFSKHRFPFVLSMHASLESSVRMCLAQEDPSVQIAAEAMQGFRPDSAQEGAPGTLPEAVLQLLPRSLYTGKLVCLPTTPVVLHSSCVSLQADFALLLMPLHVCV